MPGERWFWLDVGTACGAIRTNSAGVVDDGCPYFRRAYRGQHLNAVVKATRRRYPVRWAALPRTPAPPDPASSAPLGSPYTETDK